MERLLLDDLTGAYLRAGLNDLLDELALERARNGTHYALAMLDVDHLKTLNDVYGHATGDAALRAVAERASRVLRAGDKLFRYGGDEFLLVLPGTTHDVAEAVARRVRDQVVANPVEAAVWVSVNVSLGVAATDEPGCSGTSEELFERADKRLYMAKRAGRNTVVAGDTPLKLTREGPLRQTRLVGRESALEALDDFLVAGASVPQDRVLHLTGERGAGFTRLLNEVEVRAGIAGKVVRRVVAEPADTGVHLRALARAYGELLPPDPAEEEVMERLAQDAEAHGLVLLVEGGRWLDAGSRILLTNRLKRGGAKLVEVVLAGEAAVFQAGTSVELTPFTTAQVSEWLSAALGLSVEAATAEALAQAGLGLPARVARLVDALVKGINAEGGVPSAEKLAHADPARIRELAQLDQEPEQVIDLPEWDAPLVGRAQWLEGAKSAVGGARLTVLVGPGGVGKSRLAAQLALELAHDAPGGTHWIDLRAVRDARLVPRLVAERLGLEPTDDVGAMASQLGETTRRLVFDEMDGVADQLGWVDQLLAAAPNLRLLATARMPLRLAGEVNLNVPELSVTAASELFRRGMHRVAEVGDFGYEQDEQIEALVRRIGLSPLVVELAAAWTRAFSVEELSERLAQTPEFLTAAPGTAPLTTRFIDVTRDLMSEAEREALGTLALIPAGFTADVARSAANASTFFLLALLERSLIRREGERYTVHAAIAERYRDGLADPAGARRRVATAFAELARQLEGMSGKERTLRGYRTADSERPNLAFAVREAAASGDEQAAWPLVRLLRGYLDVRGWARAGLDLFQEVEGLLPPRTDPELRAWVGETIALYKLQLEDLVGASERIAGALALLKPLGPTKTAGLALNTFGMILATQGEWQEALRTFERSAAVREQIGDSVGAAQARGNLAIVLLQMNRHPQALSALRAALVNYRKVQHYTGVALTQLHIASLGRESGLLTLEERNEQARAALELAESIGYAQVARDAAGELATGLEEARLFADAQEMLERALEWAQTGEDEAQRREYLERIQRVSQKRQALTEELAQRN